MEWNIAPNPSSGRIQVALDSHQGEAVSINILDTSGKLVYSKNISNLETSYLDINMENSARGMYYIQLKTELTLSTKKLLLIK